VGILHAPSLPVFLTHGPRNTAIIRENLRQSLGFLGLRINFSLHGGDPPNPSRTRAKEFALHGGYRFINPRFEYRTGMSMPPPFLGHAGELCRWPCLPLLSALTPASTTVTVMDEKLRAIITNGLAQPISWA